MYLKQVLVGILNAGTCSISCLVSALVLETCICSSHELKMGTRFVHVLNMTSIAVQYQRMVN